MQELLVRLIFGGSDTAFYGEVVGYWTTYGGFRALRSSRWLKLSLIIAIVLYPDWKSDQWTSSAISILPSLLGFSIGAMAIIFAFPTSNIFKFIAEDGRSDSFYIQLAAKFVHFVVVQIIALIAALIASVYCSIILNAFGLFLLIYALLVGAATTFALFGVAQLYNRLAEHGTSGNENFTTNKCSTASAVHNSPPLTPTDPDRAIRTGTRQSWFVRCWRRRKGSWAREDDDGF